MDERKFPGKEQGEPEKQPYEKQSDYMFMQETIKNDNRRGQRYRKSILKTAGLGLIFGIAACISFSALKPWIDEKFPDDSQKIVIPEEETDTTDTEKKDETTTEKALDTDSHRELQQSLTDVASESAKSVVEIVGISGEQDWIDESYDNKNSVSGLIIADNGQELLIYGSTSVLKTAKEIHIVFPDGSVYPASVKKKDESLGFAIYAVGRSSIQQSTWSQIRMAALGSSNSVQKGEHCNCAWQTIWLCGRCRIWHDRIGKKYDRWR